MARPILEQLDKETRRLHLEEWEPALCIQVWSSLKQCYQLILAETEQEDERNLYQDKTNKLFEKICRLDIRAAAESNT